MPISVAYRPAIVTTCDAQVDLDGWAAGQLSPAVVDAQGTLWVLTSLQGWHEAPAPRTAFQTRPSEHGALDTAAYLEVRVVTLDGYALAVDLASARRARDIMASVCGDPTLTGTLVVTEPGQPTRQCVVRRSGETKTRPTGPQSFVWSLILTAPDPRRYAVAESSDQTGLPGAGAGGLVFPLVYPLTFGTGSAGGEMTLTNTGTIATWPTWEILGPATGPIITNLTTGQRLEFDPTFVVPDGQTLSIDADAKTVLLQGVNRRDKLFTAEWFQLPPGDTNVRFAHVGAFDADAQLTATWRDAWT